MTANQRENFLREPEGKILILERAKGGGGGDRSYGERIEGRERKGSLYPLPFFSPQ